MKANANDYSALDPVQDKALGARLWLHDAQRWDLLVFCPAIVNPPDQKLVNLTSVGWGVATQRNAEAWLIESIDWASTSNYNMW